MRTIGCFGGGVDSTTLLAIDLDRDRSADLLQISRAQLDDRFPSPELWVFSNTGAEHDATYRHLDYVEARLGSRLVKVRKDGETILEWNLRLGTVPLMPGASHICSLKYKGEVMEKWAAHQFNESIHWLIGIEANEEKRAKRFQKPRDSIHNYSYPLIDLELTREGCEWILDRLGWPLPEKSSCVHCPFKSEDELRWMFHNDQAAWQVCLDVETAFREASDRKNQLWIDAGKPLNKGGRAPRGMWRLNSWAEGARLFAKKIDGKQLSLEEWAQRFESENRIPVVTVD